MQPPPIEIACQELRDRVLSDEALCLIDCREPHEHEIVSLPGAVLIPMAQIPDRVGEITGHDGPVVVYCHHGMRSLRVASWLRQNGFPNAQSLAGGIDAWSLEIDPTAPRY